MNPYDVVVIGGGPGGATCATMLARAGRRVLVLERHRFPRFHIGESISVYGLEHFQRLGVFETLKQQEFIKKRGIEFALPEGHRKAYFPIEESADAGRRAWTFQMTRDKLDQILLDKARESGAEVLEEQAVTRVLFDGDRAVGVEFRDTAAPGAPLSTVHARWVVDASGQAAVINRQLKGNCYNDVLLENKIAVFCHMSGDLGFENEDDDELNFKLCVHENGRDWAWFIPVERDLVSLGVVLSRETVRDRDGKSLEQLFHEAAAGTTYLKDFLKKPELKLVGRFRGIHDYSYRSRRYFGNGWALVGDSAGFIDPLFSTGIQITFNSAFKLAEILDRQLASAADGERALKDYERTLDRFYRVASILTYLFYLARLRPKNFESAWYVWKHVTWAGWSYRWQYLWNIARITFTRGKVARAWGEEVLFGNPRPGNRIADLFYLLSKNYDAAGARSPEAARGHFVDLET